MNPFDYLPAAQVTYRPTGEVFGVGDVGMTVSNTVIIEGPLGVVAEAPEQFQAHLAFDLPVKLGLGDELWSVEHGETTLQARLLPQTRGDELWDSLKTTTLPEFTRVWIHAAPAFFPQSVEQVASTVLDQVDLMLVASGQHRLTDAQRTGLSLRAYFFDQGGQAVASATVPLTGEIRYESPAVVPITPALLDEVETLREQLVEYVTSKAQNEPFTDRVIRAVHDFGFFAQQHPEPLARLYEEVLRNLLLVVVKQLFVAEGEAINQAGKTDIKVVNPENRYEFVVVELKIWNGEASVTEVMQQATEDHATGQEALIVAQVISRKVDFKAIAEKVVDLVANHPNVCEPLEPRVYPASKELVYLSSAHVHGQSVPFALSIVQQHPPTAD